MLFYVLILASSLGSLSLEGHVICGKGTGPLLHVFAVFAVSLLVT